MQTQFVVTGPNQEDVGTIVARLHLWCNYHGGFSRQRDHVRFTPIEVLPKSVMIAQQPLLATKPTHATVKTEAQLELEDGLPTFVSCTRATAASLARPGFVSDGTQPARRDAGMATEPDSSSSSSSTSMASAISSACRTRTKQRAFQHPMRESEPFPARTT